MKRKRAPVVATRGSALIKRNLSASAGTCSVIFFSSLVGADHGPPLPLHLKRCGDHIIALQHSVIAFAARKRVIEAKIVWK